MMLSCLRYVLIFFAVLSIAACSSNKHKQLKPLELDAIDATAKIKVQWSRTIGEGPGEYFNQFLLASDDAYLYAASVDGQVYKLDKAKGRKRWNVSLRAQLTSGVSIDAARVYIGAIDGALIALDKQSGEQLWSFQMSSEMVSPAAIKDDIVVVHASNGEIYAIDARDGKQLWRVDGNMPALTIRGTSRPIFFADFVAVGAANGKMLLLDLKTGQLKGEPRIATAEGDSEIERIVDIDSTAMIDDDKLYVVSYQGQALALDLKSGQTLWTQKESSYRDVALGFGNMYIVSDNSTVLAYDKRSGDLKWVQERLLRRKLSAPATFSSYIIVGDYEGYIHVLSQIDGEFVARKKVNGSGVRNAILVDGKRFYVLSNNGKLKAYELDLIQ